MKKCQIWILNKIPPWDEVAAPDQRDAGNWTRVRVPHHSGPGALPPPSDRLVLVDVPRWLSHVQ